MEAWKVAGGGWGLILVGCRTRWCRSGTVILMPAVRLVCQVRLCSQWDVEVICLPGPPLQPVQP